MNQTADITSEQFKHWFGHSIVKHNNGTPRLCFHGTAKEFTEFSHSAKGLGVKVPLSHLGFFFTDNKNLAHAFTRNNFSNKNSKPKKGAKVLEVYLKLENPFYLSAWDFLAKSNHSLGDLDQFVELLKRRGHDGIIILKDKSLNLDEFLHDQYVVFTANQIKSVHNNGEFNPLDSDMYR